MSYEVTALKYATSYVKGPQIFFQSHWEEWRPIGYYVFLLKGPDGSHLLVDCGMDDSTVLDDLVVPSLGPRGRMVRTGEASTLAQLLSAASLTVDQIDAVLLTHLHIDHIANVALLPNARFVLGAHGWDEFQRLRRDLPSVVPDPAFPRAVIDYLDEIAETRLSLVADADEVVPGITAHHIGGHTADSTAFIVDTSAGRMLFPGDTIMTRENLATGIPVGNSISIEQSARALQWAGASADVIIPAHEPELLDRSAGPGALSIGRLA